MCDFSAELQETTFWVGIKNNNMICYKRYKLKITFLHKNYG